MIAIRPIYVVSFLLLTACAPRPPVNEVSSNLQTPLVKGETAQDVTAPTNAKISGKGKEIVQAGGTEKNQIEGATNKEGAPVTNKKLGAASSSASKITSWELSGGMAARAKNKGWSATINWVQRGSSQYQIRLSGPLGSGTILVSRNGGAVTLRDGPKTASSSNGESLLKQQTGVSLPVNNLYYWARGIPAPGSVQSEKRDSSGRLTLLRQAGYTIQFLQYTAAGKAILPSNIRLQGNGVFIKLIVRNWRV